MAKKPTTLVKSAKTPRPRSMIIDVDEATLAKISKIISASHVRALQSVNTVLINLYWNVGERISRKIAAAE